MALESSMSQRIDQWLWFARLCKSRTLAQKWLDDGKVTIEGKRRVSSSQPVKPGDVIHIKAYGEKKTVTVVGIGLRRGPANEAQQLYELTFKTKEQDDPDLPPVRPGQPPRRVK